jgi:hypothetical protein
VHLAGAEKKERFVAHTIVAKIVHDRAGALHQGHLEKIVKVRLKEAGIIQDVDCQGPDRDALAPQRLATCAAHFYGRDRLHVACRKWNT